MTSEMFTLNLADKAGHRMFSTVPTYNGFCYLSFNNTGLNKTC